MNQRGGCNNDHPHLASLPGTGPRRPGMSFWLSALMPGLGEVYCGRLLKGLLIFLIFNFLLAFLFLSPVNFFIILIMALLIRILSALEALRDARSTKPIKAKIYQRWYIYLGLFILGISGEWGSQSLLVPKIEVFGSSMSPGLRSGDLLMTNPIIFRFRDPTRGEVVVLKDPLHTDRLMIKRVAAVAGEEIAQGDLRINIVPEGHIFVLGDNLDVTADSRVFGPVPLSSIISKPLRVYWSWDRGRERLRWNRIGKPIN